MIDGGKFWSHVQIQFENGGFAAVLSVKSTVENDPRLARELIPFLASPSCITEEISVLSRFETMSNNVKLNFVFLMCYCHDIIDNIPEFIMENDLYKEILLPFVETPKRINHRPIENPESSREEQQEIGVFETDPTSSSFFDELDRFLTMYPRQAEDTLRVHFPVTPFQAFYNSVGGFFAQHRSPESCEMVARFVIKPYIAGMKASANRLVSDALIHAVKFIPEVFVSEVIQPIVFDQDSEVYQFELLQRLFNAKELAPVVLSGLFEKRTPSLEAPMKREALNYVCTAIQKSSQLEESSLMNVMMHLRTQLEHNTSEAARLFVFFLKSQELRRSDLVDAATSIIEILPAKMQPLAMKSLERNK